MADVTILIPTFNRGELLQRAVASALAQAGASIVVVVSDNSPTPVAGELLEKMYPAETRIRYIHQNPNLGMVGNFNYLVGQVRTQYFAFLTDDDYQLPGFIEAGLRGLGACSEAAFSAQRVPGVTTNRVVVRDQLDSWPHFGKYAIGEALPYVAGGAHPILTGCIFRTEIARDVVFPEEIGASGDMLLMLKLTSKHPFVLVDNVGAHFVLHSESQSTNGGGYSCPILGRIEEICSKDPEIDVELRKILAREFGRYVDRQYFKSLVRALRRGHRSEIEFVSTHIRNRGRYMRFLGAVMGLCFRVEICGRPLIAATRLAFALRKRISRRPSVL